MKLKDFDDTLRPQKVIGIDEVGRGSLAGPLLACGVLLPDSYNNFDIMDSKNLSEKARARLAKELIEIAIDYEIFTADAETIDSIGIGKVNVKAFQELVSRFNSKMAGECVFICDFCQNFPPDEKVLMFTKAESLSLSVAAASIIAKYTRDMLMIDYSKEYPGYEYDVNKGYGTKKHIQAIAHLGLTPIHRRTFVK